MAAFDDRITQLEAAIAAQEALRPTLGDAVVEVTLAALRAQLEALSGQPAETERREAELSPEQLLARLQSYLPRELAQKMQATGRIEGERKQVTVLFADISGFTALGERLDPEEVALLTNDALKELAEAVYQYEGYIDKFVGDAVMAVFGAPVAHEDDPERALRTALAMRERLEGFNRRWAERLGQPLELHIGVNTGLVVAGNVGTDLRLSYTVMGDTVNTASRLVDAAQPGQILVSRGSYRLTQDAFTFVALEPIQVKGKREPLAVLELQRARLHPGKTRGLEGLVSGLVGREDEMARLRTVERELTAGQGCIVTLTGEAGIGKSRLMAEWRAEMGERVRWLEGRAFAHTTTLAYGPFLDLIRHLAGIKDEDSETQARARLHAAVDRLFPGHEEAHALFANVLAMRLSTEEAALLARFPAEALRRRTFALIEELVARFAAAQPTVLVIEDMHWADATSMALVEHLLLLTGRAAVAIVGVFRLRLGEAPSHLQSVVAAHYPDRFLPITLAPLSQRSSLEMVEQLLSVPQLPLALRSLILSKAEGNPFFVEEVIRSLIERGALVPAAAGPGWMPTSLIERVSVPDSLQGLLMARLDRLPEEVKWVAQQAAVIGRIFLYRVLRQLSENNGGLDADLSQLEREELIRERTRSPEVEYIFRHALTQETAYQSLLAPRRKALHRRVGEAMEVLFAGRLDEFNSILANHFFRAEAWEQAVEYLTRAGDAASRLYAHVEARVHYDHALTALSELPDSLENRRRRIDTITKLARVSFLADPPERNLARLQEAELLASELTDPAGTPAADRWRLTQIDFMKGRSHYLRGEMNQAHRHFKRLRDAARELGSQELAAIAASEMGRVMVVQGQFGEGGGLLVQALAVLEQAADWAEWILAVDFYGIALAMRGQCAAGLAEGRRAVARALETNYLTGVAQSEIVLGVIHFAAGEIASAWEACGAGLRVAEQSRDEVAAYVGHGFSAWAASRLGEHEVAMTSMARAREFGQSRGGQIFLADWFHAITAEIALNAGRAAEAAALAQEAAATAEAFEGLFSEGIAQRVWGQALAAADPPGSEEAEAHLACSLRAFEAGDCRVEVARTHLTWGQLCRRRQDPTSAIAHFQRAAVQFDAAGLERESALARGSLEQAMAAAPAERRCGSAGHPPAGRPRT